MTLPKNGLIYTRVSTQEQAKEGQSIDAQIKISNTYAKENKIAIVDIYKDGGKSGSNTNRAGLQDMLARITNDKAIDCVLVMDTDRLARNTLDHLSIKALLKKHDVQLISISQPMIDDSPEGRFIDTVLAGANALQSQITGRKTSKVMEEKAKAGWWPDKAPIGYQNTINPNPTSNLDKRIITPHPQTGPIVTQIFKDYATGTFSTDSLVKKVNSLGLTNNQSRKIAASTMNRVLNSPMYYGVIPWKDKLYPGKHKPLTSKTIWDICQQIMDVHNQHANRTRKYSYLLRGFVYCVNCHHRLWAAPSKKMAFNYYYCHKCGKGTYVDVPVLEKQIEKWVGQLEVTDRYAQDLAVAAKQALKDLRSNSQEEEKLLINQKTAIKAKMQAAEDRLLDNTLKPEQFKEIMDRLDPQLNDIEQAINTSSSDYSDKFERIKNLVNMARNLKQTYRDADPDLKRYYLSLFFSKFMVKAGKAVEAIPSEDIKPLLKNGKIRVRVKTNWLRRRDSNSQLSD